MRIVDFSRSGVHRGRVSVERTVTARQAEQNARIKSALQTGEADAYSLNDDDGNRTFVFGVDAIDDADVTVG